MVEAAIRVEGLKEFQANLRKLDSDLPKALRMAFNTAAEMVVDVAKPKVPTLTGKARRSVKARSTRTAARVQGGSKAVPYYPWLDFGGRVGRNKSIRRPFIKNGRYIYDAYFTNRDEFAEVLEMALIDVARQAGVVVEDG